MLFQVHFSQSPFVGSSINAKKFQRWGQVFSEKAKTAEKPLLLQPFEHFKILQTAALQTRINGLLSPVNQ